jgi:hypothetical protein
MPRVILKIEPEANLCVLPVPVWRVAVVPIGVVFVEAKTKLADIEATVPIINGRISENLGGNAQDAVIQQGPSQVWVRQQVALPLKVRVTVAAELLDVGFGKNIADQQVTLVPEFRDVHAKFGMHR